MRARRGGDGRGCKSNRQGQACRSAEVGQGRPDPRAQHRVAATNRSGGSPTLSAHVAADERIYAIGDIHGREDLFSELMTLVRQDNAARPSARTKIVILGDVIDRGPDSAALVTRLMRYTRDDRFKVLKGNHEQTMVAALSGDLSAARAWIRFGGVATLASWGVPSELLEAEQPIEIISAARKLVPRTVMGWIDRLPLTFRSGDVLFVHAGLRPGVPLHKQKPRDLLWIGKEFTEDATMHPLFVVHGHSIHEDGPDVRANRIGVDTGAYRTGRLTALGLEADCFWSLSTAAI